MRIVITNELRDYFRRIPASLNHKEIGPGAQSKKKEKENLIPKHACTHRYCHGQRMYPRVGLGHFGTHKTAI
jgi:hypothetical protein